MVENYPYEPEEKGFDYVRLASIAAGDQTSKILLYSLKLAPVTSQGKVNVSVEIICCIQHMKRIPTKQPVKVNLVYSSIMLTEQGIVLQLGL